MMCRKCFSAYERYYKLEADIEKTLLELLMMVVVMRRRMREKWKLG